MNSRFHLQTMKALLMLIKLGNFYSKKLLVKLFVSLIKVFTFYSIIYKTTKSIFVVLMRHTTLSVILIRNSPSMMIISS
jgi:hypothetical protein